MSQNSELFKQYILGAEVWQAGHLPLSGGKHSDVKLDLEKLAEHRTALRVVMSGVADKLFERDVDGVIPVPDGALKLARRSFPLKLPQIIPSKKIDSHEFKIEQDWAKRFVKKAGRLAIFEDVVTTGSTSLAMLRTVKNINPDVELDLIGIWRRDELGLEVDSRFATQIFLVEKPIAAWPAEECTQCHKP